MNVQFSEVLIALNYAFYSVVKISPCLLLPPPPPPMPRMSLQAAEATHARARGKTGQISMAIEARLDSA